MSGAANTIALGEGLSLPAANAASQVYAFMGRRGSGKTYGCGRLIEQLLEHGGQVCIIDPVGIWHGLRRSSDGKGPGYDVPVFGGWHGDLPLPPTAGAVFADLVATKSTSIVLDVADMTGAEQRRFVAEFCTELFQAKKRNRSPLLVVFEEAQEFVPQNVRGDSARMVGAVERLIKLGRNYGVGAVLISQRPQAVNKDVLNQTELMLAFQLTGPQERKAIAAWVQEVGAGDRAIADELPSLQPGTCIAWSPQWLGTFGRHRILKKKTYDASATPIGRDDSARKLPPIDLDEVREALRQVEEELADNDVEALKAEVKRLRREVRQPAPPPRVQRVEVVPPALMEKLRTLKKLTGSLEQHSRTLSAELTSVFEAADLVIDRGNESPGNTSPAHIVEHPRNGHSQTASLPKGALRLLSIIKSRHPERLRADQLAALAVMTKSGGTYSTYMSKLVGRGLIDRHGGTLGATPAGLTIPTPPVPDRRQLVAEWKTKLVGRSRDIFETLALEHEVKIDELCERFSMSRTGGTWQTYRGRIVGLGIVVPGRGTLKVHPELEL
jgi:hypothetical protein